MDSHILSLVWLVLLVAVQAHNEHPLDIAVALDELLFLTDHLVGIFGLHMD